MTYYSGKNNFELIQASPADITDILNIEDESFVPGIRERPEVFRERLSVNPKGFFVLAAIDYSAENTNHLNDKTSSSSGAHKTICGYITTELWKKIPHIENPASPPDMQKISHFFKLGHSIEQTHCADGTVLYVSSMGLLPSYRGLGLGKFLFNSSVKKICADNSSINTVVLLVNELWTGARKIYRNAGFKEFAAIPDFFNNNGAFSNGIIMFAHKEQLTL